jgi:competence protein ComEA
MESPEIPSTFADRLREVVGTRREAWVLAAVAVVLVGGGLALWLRAAPAKIAPPAMESSAPVATASADPSGVVVIHVAGEVQDPGLYSLPLGARVADAVAAAGGPTRRGDLDLLNLAEVLVDGAKIEVLAHGDSAGTPATSGTPSSGTAALVSINSGDQVALEAIPGIGPVKAAAIISYREESGPFASIEQLLEVSGIGPATLESLRPYVTL